MKKLIVSIKTSKQFFDELEKKLNFVKERKAKKTVYELSFDNHKDFMKFSKSMDVLSAILKMKPKSIYELAKILGKDEANLGRIIAFLENVGAIRIKESKIKGRMVRTPIVDYDKIEFDLAA